MICNNCNTSIPDEVFAVMKKTAGDNVRCFGCGFLLTELIDKQEEYFDYNIFPYPLALVYERYVKGIQQKEPPLDILISIKDFVEVLVKYATIVQLSFALKEKLINPSNSSQILQGLARPSLGTWVDLLGVISKIIKDHYCNLNTSHDILNIYDSLFNYYLRKADKKHEQKDVLKSIWDFVTFRNNVLGHGAKQSNVDYLNYVNKWNSVINKWVGLLDALSGIKLLIGQSKTNLGITCRGVSFQVTNNSESNKLSISFSDKSFYCLSPFIFINSCDSCNAQLLFFYDSDKNYGDKNPKVNSLEYHGGHKSALSYPVIELEEIFGKKQLLDSFKPIRIRIAEIDSSIIKAPELIKKHARIIGREFLKNEINLFLKKRAGVFILTAQPGMGKTAFASYLIDNGYVNSYFIYRRTSSSSSADDFTKSTYYSLLQNFGIVDQENADNILALRVKLKNLLADISSKFLRKNEKCIILVDALDEGTASRDGITTIQAVPFELPDNIFIVLTSRPIKELDEVYILPEVYHYNLEPFSEENILDGKLYLESKFPKNLSGDLNLEKIVKLAEGNFLLLQLITEAVQSNEINPFQLEIDIAKTPGLHGYYSRYWEILIQKCGDSRKDINLLSDFLGLLSISRSPLKEDIIAGALKLSTGDYTWTLRNIRQFIDVIEENDEKYLRLFHDTFRDFVRNHVSADLQKYHLAIAEYFNTKNPQITTNAYGFRHKAYHLAAAWEIDALFEWITSGIEDGTSISRQMIIQTLDDLQRDKIILKKSQLKCNKRSNDILQKIYLTIVVDKVKSYQSSENEFDRKVDLEELAKELAILGRYDDAIATAKTITEDSSRIKTLEIINLIIEQKRDEIDCFIVLLQYIKSFHGLQGISIYFSFKLRELPTPIAIAAKPLAQVSNNYFQAMHRLIDVTEIILKFCSTVLICQYYYSIKSDFDFHKDKIYTLIIETLERPSLGVWQMIIFEICRELNLPFYRNFHRKRFKTIEKGTEKKYDDIFSFLITKRNQFAHGSTPSDEECKSDCDNVINALDTLIDQLSFYSNYKILQIIEAENYRLHVKYLIGENLTLAKDEWLNLLNPINEKSILYLQLPNGTITPMPFVELTLTNDFIWYNSVKKNNIEYFNYSNGHKHEKIITEETSEIFKKIFNTSEAASKDKIKNNSEFITKKRWLNIRFKGRRDEINSIKEFIKNQTSGFLIISGPPNIGKSSLIANAFNNGLGTAKNTGVLCFYFLRKGTINETTNYLLTYLNNHFDVTFPDLKPKIEHGATNDILYAQLQNKWEVFSNNNSTTKLVYIIDGLNEGDEDISNYLPKISLAKILFILSTRTDHNKIENYLNHIAYNNRVDLELKGLSKLSVLSLLSDYVNKYEIQDEWIKYLMNLTDGVPLYIWYIIYLINKKELKINDFDNLPKNRKSLEDIVFSSDFLKTDYKLYSP